MDLLTDMPTAFPLMRGGGTFLVAVGLGLVVGVVVLVEGFLVSQVVYRIPDHAFREFWM